MFPTDGNRFAVRIKKKGVNSTSSLPSGTIVKTTHTEKPGGYNTGTKSDFETDGSLVAIFDITAATKNAYDREVKIAWTKAGAYVADSDFVTYTFDLSHTRLAEAPAEEGLQAITVGDTLTELKFDTEKTVNSVKSILAGLSYENAETDDNKETIDLLVAYGALQDNGVLKATRVLVEENTYEYVLSVFPTNSGNIKHVWASVDSEEMGIEEGFQNLSNGKITVSFTVGNVLQGTSWNGILVGK